MRSYAIAKGGVPLSYTYNSVDDLERHFKRLAIVMVLVVVFLALLMVLVERKDMVLRRKWGCERNGTRESTPSHLRPD